MRKTNEARMTMKLTILTALVLAAALVLTRGSGVARSKH